VVKVRATVEYEVDVPHDWKAEMIEFRYNDSTWCATNLIGDLKQFSEEKAKKEGSDCLCQHVKVEYVETVDDTPKRSES